MSIESKPAIRRMLRERLAGITSEQRHIRSLSATSLLVSQPVFKQASVVMLYLSTNDEVDTAAIALRCWQSGKSVVVPKVSWDQRRMMPVEINSLQTGMTQTGGLGIREPIAGKPQPINAIDLVIVPGLGFTPSGNRIGRGMGFYDRFLAQPEFLGTSCGLAFEEQVLDSVPVLAHDIPLGMLITDRAVRQFASPFINC